MKLVYVHKKTWHDLANHMSILAGQNPPRVVVPIEEEEYVCLKKVRYIKSTKEIIKVSE